MITKMITDLREIYYISGLDFSIKEDVHNKVFSGGMDCCKWGN